jgi:Kef-type K+ transport system membrane component KefB
MPFSVPIADPVLQLTIVVGAVLLMRMLFEQIRLPGLIGLLLVGMFLGPGGYEVLPKAPFIDLLGSVGLVFIMFMAGVELDLKMVRAHRNETVAFGLLAFTLSIVPAIGAGYFFLEYQWPPAILFGALLSSHTLISYPMVEKIGLLHRKPVVAAVGGTLITDTLALAVLVIVLQIAEVENKTEIPGGAITTFALLAALIMLSLWLVPRVARWIFGLADVRRAEKALFVLLIILSLSLAAELIGAEDILGAFLAGLCLNQALKEREDLSEHVQFAGRLLFIPFFFVSTGMELDLAVFTGQAKTWYLAGMLVGLVVFGKMAAAWVMKNRFGYTRYELVLMVAMTLPQAAATLAIATAARAAGLFDETVLDAVIILIFVTSLVGPLLTKWAGKHMAESVS